VLHAFIDTNIYLGFYAFAADDLNELRKLQAAIGAGELKLWSTDQVVSELKRNRENKIAESVKGLRDLRPANRMPQMARNLDSFAELDAKRRAYDEGLVAVEESIRHAGSERSLAADAVLRELLDAAETASTSGKLLEKAQRRSDVGNPPGKPGSLGDAIHWEALLERIPTGHNLHLVTGDGDFVSLLDATRANELLRDEWRSAKDADIFVYRRIGDFLKAHFPSIQIAAEFEKELKIRRLVASGSFDRTHNAISALSPYTDFSDEQAIDLLDSALDNSQINWIIGDSDVKAFYRRLFETHGHLLTARRQDRLAEELGLSAPRRSDDAQLEGAAGGAEATTQSPSQEP
jgi:hypothetical protein